MTDRLHRLHQALVDELDRRGHPPDRPVTVAEIYEELVPYRTARAALDVHVRADWEHTLLRLLAGEESLVRIEPEDARSELRREVDKPYPDVALYRKFAASDAFVTPAPTGTGDAGEPGPVGPDDAGAVSGTRYAGEPDGLIDPETPEPAANAETPAAEAPAGAEPAEPAEPGEPGEPGVPPGPTSADAERVPGAGGGACTFCGRALPADRVTRFCPQCGGDQRLEPCARCGEPLEPAWRFCIACGLETDHA